MKKSGDEKSLKITLYSFEGTGRKKIRRSRERFLNKDSGDDGENGTPVPIPNTAVKLLSAEDT